MIEGTSHYLIEIIRFNSWPGAFRAFFYLNMAILYDIFIGDSILRSDQKITRSLKRKRVIKSGIDVIMA